MALLPNESQPLLSGFLLGKTLAQESENLDVRRENQSVRHQLAMWQNYAHSLENALNELNSSADGAVATAKALIDEGLSCDHAEHHKLSHNKGLRDQIYDKGAKESVPVIKKPRT